MPFWHKHKTSHRAWRHRKVSVVQVYNPTLVFTDWIHARGGTLPRLWRIMFWGFFSSSVFYGSQFLDWLRNRLTEKCVSYCVCSWNWRSFFFFPVGKTSRRCCADGNSLRGKRHTHRHTLICHILCPLTLFLKWDGLEMTSKDQNKFSHKLTKHVKICINTKQVKNISKIIGNIWNKFHS